MQRHFYKPVYFRYFPAKYANPSLHERFDKDKTMRPHVNMSGHHVDMSAQLQVRACDCNWLLSLLWGSEFEINSNKK